MSVFSFKALRSDKVKSDSGAALYSQRILGDDRLCINRISDVGVAPDQYSRMANINTVNTLVAPGCFDPNYMIERENQVVRQFYLNALSNEAAAAIGENVNPNAHNNMTVQSTKEWMRIKPSKFI